MVTIPAKGKNKQKERLIELVDKNDPKKQSEQEKQNNEKSKNLSSQKKSKRHKPRQYHLRSSTYLASLSAVEE